MPRIVTTVLWTGLVGLATGCAPTVATAQSASLGAPPQRVHASLVTPGQSALGMNSNWQFSRNDRLIGQGPPPVGREIMALEVRSRDRIRTVNGRPVDTSSTTSWSIWRRVSP